MLRCISKVLALLRVSKSVVGEASEEDWCAHLVWVDQRKCLLLTHGRTLFSVFVPDVAVADPRPVAPFVVSAIESGPRLSTHW